MIAVLCGDGDCDGRDGDVGDICSYCWSWS